MPPMRSRSDELQRPRSRQGANRDDVTFGEMAEVDYDRFTPSSDWDEVVAMLWDATLTGGQRDFYQDGDLAMLYIACEEMQRYRSSSRPSAMLLHEVMGMLSNLLVSEGDRRRARVELQRPEEQKAGLRVSAMMDYGDYFNQDGTPKMPMVGQEIKA